MLRQLFLAVLLVCSTIAVANEVQLVDGTAISGKLLNRTTTEIHFEVNSLSVFIPKEYIELIDGKNLKTDCLGEFEARYNELGAKDVEALFRLAQWCEQHKLDEQAKTLYGELAELAPWHEEANLKLGKIKHNGLWWTKAELDNKGLRLHQGEWLSKEEIETVKGKFRYLDQWVSKKDKELLESRKYGSKLDGLAYKLCDLKDDIRVINFVNRLNLSNSQAKDLVKILAKSEAERRGFLDKRHEINSECEVTWLRLKEAAMHGVIDSFNVSSGIEGPAGQAELAWIKMGKAYTHRMVIRTNAFIKALTAEQQQEIMYGMCGDCHCAIKNSEFAEPPLTIKKSQKHCSRPSCHSSGSMETKTKTNKQVDDQALELVDKIRSASPDQLNNLSKRVLELYPNRNEKSTKETTSIKTQRNNKHEEVLKLIEKIRRMLDSSFREQKEALANMLTGESELTSLSTLSNKDATKMQLIMRPQKTQTMYTKYVLSDGRLFTIVAERLRLSDTNINKIVRESLSQEEYAVPKDIMFDKGLRIKAGADLYNLRCGVCHTIDKSQSAVKTRDEWFETLKSMKHISYILAENECDLICDFLTDENKQEE